MKRPGAPIAPANWKSKEMPKAKEAAGMRGMRLPSLFVWEKGQEEYIFHHPLLRKVPLLLRKEARKGALTMQMV